MATLKHGSFSHNKPPPATCHLINRSQFHLALDSQSLFNEIDCHNSEESEVTLNSQAKQQYFPQIPEISHQLVKQLQEAINLCSVFTQELNILCGIGAKTACCLSAVLKELLLTHDSPFQNLGDFPNPQEMAGHFLETWDQLALATSAAVAAVQQNIFATLQEATMTIETNPVKDNNNITTSNQIAVTCLWALIQLQLQFSLSFNKSLSTFSSLFPQNTETLSNLCGLKNDVNILASEPLMSCIGSIIGIHHHFSSISHAGNSKPTSPSHIEVGLNNHEYQSNKPVELDSKLSLQKENPCYRRWSVNGVHQNHFHQQHNIENKYTERHLQRRWSVPGPHPYRGLWDPGPSTESPNKSSVGDQIPSDEKLVGSLASTEELQEVINLLSCQPSNPPSPTSESSLSFSTLPNQVGFESHLSVWPAIHLSEGPVPNQRDSSDLKERDKSSVQFMMLDSARKTGTWPRTSGNNSADIGIWGWLPDKDGIPGNSPDVSEATKLFRLPQDHSELVVENIINHPLTPSHSTLKLQRTFASTGNSSAASGEVSHPPATKSISWPVSALQIQSSGQGDSAGSSSDEASTNTISNAKNSFFMGLDLVGSDLMASVRQRRHSSSGAFSERSQERLQNPSYTPTSSRTKSIDNISCDGVAKPRTSTWPLKLPRVPSSQTGFQPGEKMPESPLPNTSFDWPLSESALGLPPTGAEGRTRHKPERKYSLFGQIS